MEKVDMVLVGAEGVVESGGIINKVIYINLQVIRHVGGIINRAIHINL